MHHRLIRDMRLDVCAILFLLHNTIASSKTPDTNDPRLSTEPFDDNLENNIIDFDEEYTVHFNKKYGNVPWHSKDKMARDSFRYTVVNDDLNDKNNTEEKKEEKRIRDIVDETTEKSDFSVVPLELVSTTENYLISIIDSTTEDDLSVIPLSTTIKNLPLIQINQTVTLPTSTQETEVTTEYLEMTTLNDVRTTTREVQIVNVSIIEDNHKNVTSSNTSGMIKELYNNETKGSIENVIPSTEVSISNTNLTLKSENITINNKTDMNLDKAVQEKLIIKKIDNVTEIDNDSVESNDTIDEALVKKIENVTKVTNNSTEVNERHVPIFSELDAEEEDVSEDYYDAKDVVPTTAPKANALTVLVGLAGSVVESVAERVVPKGIYDLFKRMQRQSEALEAERLRSREENGGLDCTFGQPTLPFMEAEGQFGRGILKSISSGLGKPLSQLMAGVRDFGSLDTDRGFVGNLASGVSNVANVANSLVDTFKDRVQAIYPGTVWCGDGHSPTARSGELGLFFFTDTCCRQHDACKLYIRAGETKHGLTNTGLFTRSHCSCDSKFRECLRKTNSLVSAQIGLTYFNVLGPQCFRKSHPIIKCATRTRITGQKCEEYELDYTKPKMWQWFDNETF